MCGIVAYVGRKNSVPIMLEGLKRLEYRGYDSSGLALFDEDNNVKIYKKEGKLIELEKFVSNTNKDLFSTIGISHTRWATHGVVNEANAHPISDPDGTMALVHNGIIENYKDLKQNLLNKGYKFKTDTDTEVLVFLVHYYYQVEKCLTKAVQLALKVVEGTYGIAIIHRDFPGQIISAKKGSTLILAIGDNEFFITSDINATIKHTKRVIYLEDGDMVKINHEGYEIFNSDNLSINPEISEIDWDISAIDKGDFKHYMLKEIFEQPISVGNAFRGRLADELNTVRLGGLSASYSDLRNVKRIQIIGCGTSWHAALTGKYMIESLARIPVEVEYASEYRYRNPIVPDDTLVFVISQSGETADTLAALKEARAKGAKVFGITNVVGSTIARETDGGVYIHAGSEIGVASTKAFTSQVTVLALLAILLGRMRHMSPNDGLIYLEELKLIPEKIEMILAQNEQIREISKSIANCTNALYLGRGIDYPVALEGALKLKEISYIHAEGYPAAEMKHGPIALIDENMPVIALASKDFLYDKLVSNLQEVIARKGRIFAVANEGDELIATIANEVIYIPETLPSLRPLLNVIPLQLIAYHVADLKQLDVDQPRNLAKSVTVE
ncbi:MAG: glutamine--fructose-6-phosphate transaminase (isomerizing) [Candidatus Cloacimonadales bacterium]|nr:glutamine--fructose-6-phosphate transaminase (isomerizing) [Candidatus Cloacimonadota bacterium]MDD2650184.1 glutamine--fructose-6-phosphate transaminase (isomerizing) [Candidatus Cloacimonadota bacterium]MDX9976961.1 glutamine--fructose-6-phosphate transaminase (isomerizing) [Candidatus Cloacimonadales bacterium]